MGSARVSSLVARSASPSRMGEQSPAVSGMEAWTPGQALPVSEILASPGQRIQDGRRSDEALVARAGRIARIGVDRVGVPDRLSHVGDAVLVHVAQVRLLDRDASTEPAPQPGDGLVRYRPVLQDSPEYLCPVRIGRAGPCHHLAICSTVRSTGPAGRARHCAGAAWSSILAIPVAVMGV